MLTELRDFYPNKKGEDRHLPAIEIPDIPEEEWKYKASDLEHFDHVFEKNAFPTYHQIYDNFLHWDWNEYGNDPERFDSDEYHNMIADKVYTYINAVVLGILTPSDNHASIVQFLEKSFPRYDIIRILHDTYKKLYDRNAPFTQDDAVIWYQKSNGEHPIYKPVLMVDDDISNRLVPMAPFFRLVFKYVFAYYNHLYASKFRSFFNLMFEDEYIYALDDVSPGTDFSEVSPIRLKDLGIRDGGTKRCYVLSKKGQYLDDGMNFYTEALIARTGSTYCVSTQRGFQHLFQSDGKWVSSYIPTLINKSKGTEALRSEQWRDIMECNAVLFKKDERTYTPALIRIRVTHLSKYINRIKQIQEISSTTFSHCDDAENWQWIVTPGVLLKLWEIFNHTLDLWVAYVTEDDETEWSLISNIFVHPAKFYVENGHLVTKTTYVTAKEEDELIAIIPRDGIQWSLDEKFYNYRPRPINGYTELKPYLG